MVLIVWEKWEIDDREGGKKKKDAIVRKVGKLEKLNCFKFGSFYSKINLILEDASGRDNEEFFEIPIYI